MFPWNSRDASDTSLNSWTLQHDRLTMGSRIKEVVLRLSQVPRALQTFFFLSVYKSARPVRQVFTPKAPKVYNTGVGQTNGWLESKLALKQRCVVLLTVFEQLVVAAVTVSGNLPSTASFPCRFLKRKTHQSYIRGALGCPSSAFAWSSTHIWSKIAFRSARFSLSPSLSAFIKSVCFPQCCSKWKENNNK